MLTFFTNSKILFLPSELLGLLDDWIFQHEALFYNPYTSDLGHAPRQVPVETFSPECPQCWLQARSLLVGPEFRWKDGRTGEPCWQCSPWPLAISIKSSLHLLIYCHNVWDSCLCRKEVLKEPPAFPLKCLHEWAPEDDKSVCVL